MSDCFWFAPCVLTRQMLPKLVQASVCMSCLFIPCAVCENDPQPLQSCRYEANSVSFLSGRAHLHPACECHRWGCSSTPGRREVVAVKIQTTALCFVLSAVVLEKLFLPSLISVAKEWHQCSALYR